MINTSPFGIPFWVSRIAVVVTSPAQNATLTSAEFGITWTTLRGPQDAFRVFVYSDASLTQLAFDSGWQPGASEAFSTSFNHFDSGATYYLVVRVRDSDGDEAASQIVTFVASWATGNNVTVTVRAVGDCGDAAWDDIPYLIVRWSQFVPTSPEVFVRYDLFRRKSWAEDWELIERFYSVSDVLTYTDYEVASSTPYLYAVQAVAQVGIETRVSTLGLGVESLSRFKFSWLHNRNDPSMFVRVEHLDRSITSNQEVAFLRAYGSRAPSAIISVADYESGIIRISPRMHGDSWLRRFRALVDAQRDDGAVLVLRDGVARDILYVNLTSPDRLENTKQYDVSINFTEVNSARVV